MHLNDISYFLHLQETLPTEAEPPRVLEYRWGDVDVILQSWVIVIFFVF